MSISATYSPTVLLWDRAWWIAGRDEPVPFPELPEAVAALAAAWGDAPKSFRLIYEPDGMVTAATDCPQTDRGTLALTLGEQFEALLKREWSWSYDPILAHKTGHSTLLHMEATPLLGVLVASLEAKGFTVTSAWPMPTWLQALPKEVSATGAVLVAAFVRDRFCLYRHSADGVRAVLRWKGEDALEKLAGYLREVFAKNTAEPVWLVPSDADLVPDLEKQVTLSDKPNVEVIALAEAVASDAVIPPEHPGRLPVFGRIGSKAGTVASAATSTVLLLLALGIAGHHGHAWWRAKSAQAQRDHEKVALRTEVAQLRTAHQAAHAAGQRTIVSGVAPVTTVIDQVIATIPREVALDSLVVTSQGFSLGGWVQPGAPAVDAWIGRLRSAQPKWALTAAPPSKDGAFQVKGVFSS